MRSVISGVTEGALVEEIAERPRSGRQELLENTVFRYV
jgi:hypothetical protein